jgi:hypothetical protein
MNHRDPSLDRMSDPDEREWRVQERAWCEERFGAAPADDALLASYRKVVRAARAPMPDALPESFARDLAAQCARKPAASRTDTQLEQQAQRVLLATLAAAATVVVVMYGADWTRASLEALPVLGRGTTLNWAAALVACLGLSWAMEALRRRVLEQ